MILLNEQCLVHAGVEEFMETTKEREKTHSEVEHRDVWGAIGDIRTWQYNHVETEHGKIWNAMMFRVPLWATLGFTALGTIAGIGWTLALK